MNRLLSRREKDRQYHKRQKSRDKSSHQSEKEKKAKTTQSEILAFFNFKYDPAKKLDKTQDAKINLMRRKLANLGYTDVGEQQLQYGFFSKHATQGDEADIDKAVELVVLFQESVDGVIKPYDPTVDMKGAVNNRGVTCWFDSLLFALFGRLSSFEPILYTIYEDPPRRRLSTLLRLWVNMLRSGILIQTDVTYYLQEALEECGWKEAKNVEQQDASEAFGFITETLQLPLLTLKMDLYHDGVIDPKDDHKRVHERLLEVAIPARPEDGRPIQLEDCLENYFNNRVEVKRMLARSANKLERSNTTSSTRSTQSEKTEVTHVEVSELSSPNTPTSIHPPSSPLTQTRQRAQSIIRRRLIPEEEQGESTDADNMSTRNLVRKQSVRNEVVVPAWQFFNLIPWYTKDQIPNDASLAAHFSQARPVLGICLKRYSMNEKGEAIRNAAYVDIPLEIQLPHFVPDETMEKEGPSMGNFKLSLQSVICHKGGQSLHSGHYISYIRTATEAADGDSASSRRLSDSSDPPSYHVDKWLRHNDLGDPRVAFVDMEKALKEETPYLLFYQVQPIFDTISASPSTADLAVPPPPSYDSGIAIKFTESSPHVDNNPFFNLMRQREEEEREHRQQGYFDGATEEPTQSTTPSIRLSSEIDHSRQGMNISEDRRGSIAFTENSLGSVHSNSGTEGVSAPITPSEETAVQRISRAASKFRKSGSKSRPTSSSGENRLTSTISRLVAARSKEQLNKIEMPTNKDAVPPIPILDGTADTPPAVIAATVEEAALRPPADSAPSRKVIRREKKQEARKSLDKEDGGHRHKKGKSMDRNGKQVPDRECRLM